MAPFHDPRFVYQLLDETLETVRPTVTPKIDSFNNKLLRATSVAQSQRIQRFNVLTPDADVWTGCNICRW
jgi:hypothetical protein